MVSQGILNMRVFDILNSQECKYQVSDLQYLRECFDVVDEQDFDGHNYPAYEGLKLLLDHQELDESKECLVKKFIEIRGGFELVQFVAAVNLYLEKLHSRNTIKKLPSGTKIIMKVIGPWEAFESKVLSFLKKEGLKRISEVIHSNRGEGRIGFYPISASSSRRFESDESIGGQGFLTIITKVTIPTQLANCLYVITDELNIYSTNQIEEWYGLFDYHIKEYNAKSRMEYDRLEPNRFTTYFAKFQAEVALRRKTIKRISHNWFPFPNMWGFFIDLDTFRTNKLFPSSKLGSRDLAIIKTKHEVAELDFTPVSTSYYRIEGGKAIKVDKNYVKRIFRKELGRYMGDNKEWPLYTTLSKKPYKTSQGNKVQVTYQPNEYDSFKIILLEKELKISQGLTEFIDTLQTTTMKPDAPRISTTQYQAADDDAPWKVETAKSGRTQCRICQEKIPKDTYRVGQPGLYQEHLSYRWYHLSCWKQSGKQFPTPEDYADLPESIKQELQSLLK